MRNLLLIIHIASAILLVGPATFSASAFPRQAAAAGEGNSTALGAARELHRASRGYGTASLVVGASGVALAQLSGFWTQVWVWVSLALFAAGYAALLLMIIPTQARLLATAEERSLVDPTVKSQLHRITGLYSLTWMVMLGLMVTKPG